jgi:large subunit ribosomal protein L25
MATKFELTAEKRAATGTVTSRRLRRGGRVPAVLYGGAKEPIKLTLDHDAIFHHLENEAFHTSILTVHVDDEADQAILRDVQMHPFKSKVLHVDLQRIVATEKLQIEVPIHFVGEEMAPGVKEQGGIVSHLMTEVEISSLPHQLPEFLTADVSQLHVGESVHLSDIVLPEGVTIPGLAHGGADLAVATVLIVREVVEEVPVEEALEPVEGEPVTPPEGATPDAGESKEKAEAKEKAEGKEKGKEKGKERDKGRDRDRD